MVIITHYNYFGSKDISAIREKSKLNKFKQYLPNDAKFVIVDDNSDRPQDNEEVCNKYGFRLNLHYNSLPVASPLRGT